jgi:hypothetical protein
MTESHPSLLLFCAGSSLPNSEPYLHRHGQVRAVVALVGDGRKWGDKIDGELILILYPCGVHPVALLTYTIQTYNI